MKRESPRSSTRLESNPRYTGGRQSSIASLKTKVPVFYRKRTESRLLLFFFFKNAKISLHSGTLSLFGQYFFLFNWYFFASTLLKGLHEHGGRQSFTTFPLGQNCTRKIAVTVIIKLSWNEVNSIVKYYGQLETLTFPCMNLEYLL